MPWIASQLCSTNFINKEYSLVTVMAMKLYFQAYFFISVAVYIASAFLMTLDTRQILKFYTYSVRTHQQFYIYIYIYILTTLWIQTLLFLILILHKYRLPHFARLYHFSQIESCYNTCTSFLRSNHKKVIFKKF